MGEFYRSGFREWGRLNAKMDMERDESERYTRFREAARIGRPTNCCDFYVNEIETVEDRA